MFYADILTREKIKAGKYILDKLAEEGWEVHGAAWLLHGRLPSDDEWYPGYEIFKHWSLHFLVKHYNREAAAYAYNRISELRNAYIDELYDDALFEDYFDVSVDSLDDRLAQWLINRRSSPLVKHPLGYRLRECNNDIRDGFVYNLSKSPAQKAVGQDSSQD